MTNKGVMSSNTIIIEKDGNLVSDEKDLVNFFNNHYINFVENTIGKNLIVWEIHQMLIKTIILYY